jgi:hypothetical protein
LFLILVKKRERETFIVRAFRTVHIKEECASERERERERRERRERDREKRERREREKSRNRKEREFFDVDPAKNSIAHTHTLLIKKDDRRSSGGTRSDKTDESSHRNVRAAAASTGVRLRGVRAETSAWGNGSANRAFEFRLSVSAV